MAGAVETARTADHDELHGRGLAMAGCLRHRGPDDEGVWTDAPTGVVLAHRRLSIIDLSTGGHQPMTSRDGRFVIVFNGEIYNYRDLRASLEASGTRFRSRSDTEVLLESIAAVGLRATLQRVRGMFALAVVDRSARTLALARDRFGEKPLYYGWSGSTFLFASETSALRAHPDFDPAVDRDAVAALLRHSYVPAPASIHRHAAKLPPGCLLEVELDAPAGSARPEPYWSLRDVAVAGRSRPFAGSHEEAVDQLDAVLGAAVAESMVADVPLGAFLSGGVDSSLVVALMQRRATGPVRTYTVGFAEPEFDEADHARAVAAHLGTQHTELYVTPAEALAVIPELADIYDEPFADASQVPTALVARLARRDVTVALSGDGGDELFAGYTRYGTAARRWELSRRLPGPARSALSSLLAGRGHRATRVSAMLAAARPEELHRMLLTHWTAPDSVVLGAAEGPDAFTDPARSAPLTDVVDRLMHADAVQYLPDAVLVKLDRAAMATSLETRVPLLDPRVAELAWSLPAGLRQRDGRSKWVLRQLLHRYVPEELVDRPKKGFGVPVGTWLRGPLRPWAEDLLSADRLARQGLLAVDAVRAVWADHLAERRDAQHELWNVLMLQAWLERTRTTV